MMFNSKQFFKLYKYTDKGIVFCRNSSEFYVVALGSANFPPVSFKLSEATSSSASFSLVSSKVVRSCFGFCQLFSKVV